MPKKEYKDLTKKEKIIGWGFLAIVVIIIVALATGGKNEEDNPNTNTNVEMISSTNLSKNAVENACQDANLGVNDGYTLIDVWDYGFNTYDYAYDENGNPIIIAEWNGKKGDTQVKFQCYVSGQDDENIEVYWIRAAGDDIWKSESDVQHASYDKDGNPVYPELHK